MSSPIINSNQYFNLINFSNKNKKNEICIWQQGFNFKQMLGRYLLWWGRPIASVLYESQELPTLILTLHKA
jgi:hypothetical protein